MQKSGVGFDYLRKFSGEGGDTATGVVQMRLVWDEIESETDVQLYDAYFKSKTSIGDFWLGHNRLSFGLSSYLDTHAELLQPLSMYGFGFDRDWGMGFSHYFQNGDFMFATTTGSGMELDTDDGSYLVTSRWSFGILPRDNYNLGVSFMDGKIFDMMGNMFMDNTLQNITLGSIDLSYNYNNFEHKFEVDYGEKNKMDATAMFYRLGINFLEENRLKLEGQYTYTKSNGMDNNFIGIGTTYRINSDLTMRLLFQREREMNDKSVIAQIYYYFRI
jgi:hypothetical protein